MEKVKVTREQAEAIEFAVNHNFRHTLIDAYMNVKGASFSEKLSVLYKLSYDDFFRALYIGYEVEPEFKVGDWVYNNVTGRVAKIDDRGYDEEVAWVDDDKVNFFTEFRHATPSEIAEEKERRWWKKHGRDVWELKNGDVLVCDGYPRTVNKVVDFEEKTVIFSDKDWEYYENVIEEYEVVCFAENRLDVSKEDE